MSLKTNSLSASRKKLPKNVIFRHCNKSIFLKISFMGFGFKESWRTYARYFRHERVVSDRSNSAEYFNTRSIFRSSIHNFRSSSSKNRGSLEISLYKSRTSVVQCSSGLQLLLCFLCKIWMSGFDHVRSTSSSSIHYNSIILELDRSVERSYTGYSILEVDRVFIYSLMPGQC